MLVDTTMNVAPLKGDELVQNAMKHMDFLRTLHREGVSLATPSAKSLNRYLNLWLPLVAHDPDAHLVPPADVAWLWHCHRLAPLQYEQFCQKIFGTVLEAKAAFECQVNEENDNEFAKSTRKEWESAYPQEPFFLNEETSGVQSGRAWLVNGFDLIGSTSRQKLFLWHVSQPRFEDPTFLEEGVSNYYKFLALPQKNKSYPLVPTFQIDLIWHTHIATSVTQYIADCIQIRGKKFFHDDSMDDRTPGAFLDVSFQETIQLWREAYGEDYVVPGGMFRGNPRPDFLDRFWDAEAAQTPAEIGVVLMVAGSNSIGIEKGDWTPWKKPSKADGTFIKAAAKSRSRGVNSNPAKTGFVFGNGALGVGYYSLDTSDAYEILYKRLKRHEEKQRSDYTCFTCCSCMGGTTFKKQKRVKELDIAKTVDMIAYIEARKSSAGPNAPLDDDKIKKSRDTGMRRNHIDDYPPYVPGYWYGTGGHVGGVPITTGGEAGFVGNCDTFVTNCAAAAGCGGGTCGGGGCGAAAW